MFALEYKEITSSSSKAEATTHDHLEEESLTRAFIITDIDD
jgi:hypothetical protein